jgi:putative SOS response-associated peptidase YedK
MCGRFTQEFEWRELVNLYNLTNQYILNLKPSWNVAPAQDVGVAVPEEGGRIFKTIKRLNEIAIRTRYGRPSAANKT